MAADVNFALSCMLLIHGSDAAAQLSCALYGGPSASPAVCCASTRSPSPPPHPCASVACLPLSEEHKELERQLRQRDVEEGAAADAEALAATAAALRGQVQEAHAQAREGGCVEGVRAPANRRYWACHAVHDACCRTLHIARTGWLQAGTSISGIAVLGLPPCWAGALPPPGEAQPLPQQPPCIARVSGTKALHLAPQAPLPPTGLFREPTRHSSLLPLTPLCAASSCLAAPHTIGAPPLHCSCSWTAKRRSWQQRLQSGRPFKPSCSSCGKRRRRRMLRLQQRLQM